jgi:excisionase family DNA binding protein
VIPDPAEQPTVALWPTAARALGLGRDRAYRLAARGELPFTCYRFGRSWRVPTAALRRALHLDEGGGDAA